MRLSEEMVKELTDLSQMNITDSIREAILYQIKYLRRKQNAAKKISASASLSPTIDAEGNELL